MFDTTETTPVGDDLLQTLGCEEMSRIVGGGLASSPLGFRPADPSLALIIVVC